MKSKIKLTDLSHFDPLNDEMAQLKGGDSGQGPICWGCKCDCDCSNNIQTGETISTNGHNGARNNGNASWGVDIAIAVGIGVAAVIL